MVLLSVGEIQDESSNCKLGGICKSLGAGHFIAHDFPQQFGSNKLAYHFDGETRVVATLIDVSISSIDQMWQLYSDVM